QDEGLLKENEVFVGFRVVLDIVERADVDRESDHHKEEEWNPGKLLEVSLAGCVVKGCLEIKFTLLNPNMHLDILASDDHVLFMTLRKNLLLPPQTSLGTHINKNGGREVAGLLYINIEYLIVQALRIASFVKFMYKKIFFAGQVNFTMWLIRIDKLSSNL
ncbi:hypothetical protein ACJX0J_034400, partial [Zea mays]